jgi:ribonuclease HI
MDKVEIFTDGACKGNPGVGGWGALMVAGEAHKELFGGELNTTNNRMELKAVIEGLSTLKRPSRVELFTDSVYVGKGLMEYMPKWKANCWLRKEGTKFVPLKNEELWRKLDELLGKHQLKYTRVAGHSGHTENDRVDQLAVDAYQRFLRR